MAVTLISPDGAHLVYVQYSEQESNALPLYELYSVPTRRRRPCGSIPRRQSSPFSRFRISPDSTYVVYERPVRERPDVPDLYSVPISGGASVPLEFPVDFLDIDWYTISADSRHIVVYCKWRHIFEIYSFQIEGGKPVRLSDALELRFLSWRAPAPPFLLSLDGTRVLYPTWNDARKQHLLVTVPVGGGAPAELATGAGPAQALDLMMLMPDGDHALYIVYDTGATGLRRAYLHSASIKNSVSVRLMELRGRNVFGDGWQLEPSPDGSRVVVQQSEAPGIVECTGDRRSAGGAGGQRL